MAAPISQQTRKFEPGELVRGVAVAAGTTIANLTVDIPLPVGLWRIGLFIDGTSIATDSLSTVEAVPINALGVAGTAGEGYHLVALGGSGSTRVITLASMTYMEIVSAGSLPTASGALIDGTVQGGSITGGVRLIITKGGGTTGTYGITYVAVRVG